VNQVFSKVQGGVVTNNVGTKCELHGDITIWWGIERTILWGYIGNTMRVHWQILDIIVDTHWNMLIDNQQIPTI
jgi:hypothetical protein